VRSPRQAGADHDDNDHPWPFPEFGQGEALFGLLVLAELPLQAPRRALSRSATTPTPRLRWHPGTAAVSRSPTSSPVSARYQTQMRVDSIASRQRLEVRSVPSLRRLRSLAKLGRY